MGEKMWVAELSDSYDFVVLICATNEKEAEEEAYAELGDNWLYVHEVELD